MYDTLKKYKTGKIVDREVTTANGDHITIPMQELEFPLGNLIIDLIELKNKPWWRRRWDHTLVVNYFIRHLNKVTVKGHW
jgi:hypothetical protein